MKKITISMVMVFSLLLNNSYAIGENSLYKQIEESIKFKQGELPLQKEKTDFVKLSFKINEDGKLEIIQMNYSNNRIKEQLIEQLKEIKFSGSVDLNEVHNYNFTFKII